MQNVYTGWSQICKTIKLKTFCIKENTGRNVLRLLTEVDLGGIASGVFSLFFLLFCYLLSLLSIMFMIKSSLPSHITSFFFINLFYYYYYFYFWLCWVFVAARGLFSGCGERGLLFVVVHRPLIAVASLVGSTGSRHLGFNSCGSWALEHGHSSCGARA